MMDIWRRQSFEFASLLPNIRRLSIYLYCFIDCGEGGGGIFLTAYEVSEVVDRLESPSDM